MSQLQNWRNEWGSKNRGCKVTETAMNKNMGQREKMNQLVITLQENVRTGQGKKHQKTDMSEERPAPNGRKERGELSCTAEGRLGKKKEAPEGRGGVLVGFKPGGNWKKRFEVGKLENHQY